MLVPVRQELLLAVNGRGTDALELSSMAQRGKQRIEIDGWIRAVSAFHGATVTVSGTDSKGKKFTSTSVYDKQ